MKKELILAMCITFSLCSFLAAQSNGATAIYASKLKTVLGSSMTRSELSFDNCSASFHYLGFPETSSSRMIGDQNMEWVQGDPEGRPIYSSFCDSVLIWKSHAPPIPNGAGWNIFTDSIFKVIPRWELIDSTVTCYNGNLCKVAKTNWGGRSYLANYLPGFPTKFGPYKFHGLPGLIAELTSEDGYVKFQLIVVKDSDVSISDSDIPKFGRHISYNDHDNLSILSIRKIDAINAANPDGFTYSGDPISNFEIEKDFWTFVRRWKAKQIKLGKRNPDPKF